MSEPDTHAHGGNSGMAMEHMRLLDLVDRSEATHVAIANGDWFDPATWHEGRIPGSDAQVLIPHGVNVTYDGQSNASLFTVRVDGELSFATDTNTRMEVDTLVVSPTGRLEIGTEDNPVRANVSTEIVIANNGDIDTGWDPMLLSRGIISHGEVEIHGAEKSTFHKVDDAPMAGDRQITLEEVPEGWQVGDTIVITGTHKQGWGWDNTLRREVYRESEDEEVTITAIDGNRITIDRPLEHDHDTPREDLAAYVSNMSRNVTVRSEDGEGTEVHHRGHVMFMHSDEVDVRYAAFDDLGRTDKSVAAFDVGAIGNIEADSNVKGRYSVHLHLTGTEDQENPSFLIGNAVSGSPGWGIVQHSSHSVIVDNAVFDAFGAAFAAEDGDETGVWGGNIAIRSEGIGWGDWTAKTPVDVARHDNGRTGDGFFFAGRLVEANDNVAANTTHGFVWMHRSAPSDPLSANLEHPEIAYGSDTLRNERAPIQGFNVNEAFGTQMGIVVVKLDSRQEHDVRTVLDGFLNWETRGGVNLTYTSHYTLKNFDLIGATDAEAEFGYRLGTNAYDMVANNMNIEGFYVGVDLTTNNFTFPVSDSDIGQIFIDVEHENVQREYIGLNTARHQIMSSEDLVEGRLEFTMTGDLTISEGETLFFNGTKTDSIGSRDRQFETVDNIQSASFQENIVPMLREQGYYTAPDGRHILLVEDFVADRATGELLKFAHQVTLQMSDTQLASLGAIDNGPITLGGPAPIARDDTVTVAPGEVVFIDVLANDRDPDGGQIRVDGMTQPDQGGAQMGPNGTILFFAGLNSEDQESFTYWAADEEGNFTPAQVTVNIDDSGTTPPTFPPPQPPAPTNTAPVAVNDTVTATLNNGQAFVRPADLLANDRDADGDTLSILSFTGAVRDNGQIRVTAPVTDGLARIEYTIGDGNGGQDTASVTVNVPQPPPPPTPPTPPSPGTGDGGWNASFYVLDGWLDSVGDVNWSAAADATEVVGSIDYQGNQSFWTNGAEDFFAARFTGTLQIDTPGQYTFFLTSDDGSTLSINGNTVIDNDGLQAATEDSATLFLQAGSHALDIRYFEAAGGQVLGLDWAGPDTNGNRSLLTDADVTTTLDDVPPPPQPQPTPQPEPSPRPEPGEADLSMNVLYVGHSLIAGLKDVMQDIVADSGGSGWVQEQNIPGASLNWNWDNSANSRDTGNSRAILAEGETDILILTEAIPLLNHITWGDPSGYAARFYNLAIQNNPDTQVFLYETWHDLRSGTGVDVPWDDNGDVAWRTRLDQDLSLWEGIVDDVNAQRAPGAPEMKLIPVGQAMGALHDAIRAGDVPGMSSIRDVFTDDIHYNDAGTYFVAMVQYMAIHGEVPTYDTFDATNQWGADPYIPPTPAQIGAMTDIAWNTVSNYLEAREL